VQPYLNDREMKILLAVLPLQVIDNIALVVIEEMSPGSVAWLSWRDILHLVDIVCCCMIMFPLVWQIRQLRLSSAVDGKVETNLQKLTQYRNFYMVVVGYIYFTRIIVYLIGATVPFYLTWFQSFANEAATIAFFVWTGWKFRPMSNNPYLPVRLEDDAEIDDEFGLDDELDIEMAGSTKVGRKSIVDGATTATTTETQERSDSEMEKEKADESDED
jgi:G protein-coupled receptor 107